VFPLDTPRIDAPIAPPDAMTGICSTTSMVVDDFEDGMPEPWWQQFPGPEQVVEANGVAQLQMTTLGIASLAVAPFLDVRGNRFAVELDLSNSLLSQDFVQFALAAPDPSFSLQFRIQGGLLFAERYESGELMSVAMRGYNASTDKFLEIAEANGTVTWSTSSDGSVSSYQPVSSFPGLTWVDFVKPELVANKLDGAGGAWTLSVDNANTAPASGTACAADRLADDFAGPTLSPLWGNSQLGPDCRLALAHQLRLDLTSDVALQSCVVISSTMYDLHDQAVVLEIQPPATPASVLFYVQTLATRQQGMFEITAGQLHAEQPGSPPYRDVVLDPALRFFRLRADATDTLFWEVSVDNITFVPFAQTTDVKGLDRVLVGFGVTAGNGTAAAVVFGGINTP
jgi:hypothetical protein